MMSYTAAFLWGALTAACGVAALLFLRFWRLSGDRLLIFFAAAFAVLALNWLVLGLSDPENEARHYAYYIRLLGFVLIIVGIIDRNRRAG
jgi:hypothetical protein